MIFVYLSAGLAVAVALFFLIRLYLSAPGRHRDGIDAFRGVELAHRGLHRNPEIPENSYEAFRLAVEAGYGIELDVQLSKDGVPVVFHDQSLDRVCKKSGSTRDYPLEELKKTPLFDQPGSGIPTFREVLDLVAGKVPLLVEIKGEDPEFEKTCRLAAELLDAYSGPYLVESFNPLALVWFRKNRPAVLRGQLCMAYAKADKYKGKIKYFILQHFLLNFRARPDFLAYKIGDKDDRAFRRQRRLFGIPCYAWTVKTQADRAAASDFDGIIFEGDGTPQGKDEPNA